MYITHIMSFLSPTVKSEEADVKNDVHCFLQKEVDDVIPYLCVWEIDDCSRLKSSAWNVKIYYDEIVFGTRLARTIFIAACIGENRYRPECIACESNFRP